MLTKEWSKRVKFWKDNLIKFQYKEIEEIVFKGFKTFDHIKPTEVMKNEFIPMPNGTRWGAKWEYAWFSGEIVVPEKAQGQRIELSINTGGESIVYLNGQAQGAIDKCHKYITLSTNAQKGEKYNILIETYAGHGYVPWRVDPVSPGEKPLAEVSDKQRTVGRSTLGIWNEEIYGLYLDVEALYQIRNNLDEKSLRVEEIDKGLRDFCNIIDFEIPFEDMMETVKKCRERLNPLLECNNGSTAPTMYTVGHSHLDVVFLWPLRETMSKAARTFSTQLKLMEQYPEYKYMQSQPQLYKYVKEYDEELYSRIKQSVKDGQLIPEGGMWVEPDANLPSGESLIRQIMHGKKFFKDEFNKDSVFCWLPDVFGFPANMPQILDGCGIKYFATQKLLFIYNGESVFPYNTFYWEGIDGTKILSTVVDEFGPTTNPERVMKYWDSRIQKNGESILMYPFGYSDGGGGATREHLEYLRRENDLEGVPRTKMAGPVEFFEEIEKNDNDKAIYKGELYFQGHRGTLTSQAKIKWYNRKLEIALRETEFWGTLTNIYGDDKYTKDTLKNQWETLLLNQFHDIIPGSALRKGNDDAKDMYAKSFKETNIILDDIITNMVDRKEAFTVFNSLSWDSNKVIEVEGKYSGFNTEEGKQLSIQKEEEKTFVEVNTPSCGYISIIPNSTPKEIKNEIIVSNNVLENSLIKVQFNEYGDITSIYDKEYNREYCKGICNELKMYKDIPVYYDAWDIDSMYVDNPVECREKAQITILSKGPLRASISISKKINNSYITQEVIITKESKRIEFDTRVEWNETHKLLKACFPVNITTDKSIEEIQYGYVERPTHRSELMDAAKFEVCCHKWATICENNNGFALLNDCKYGVDTLGNNINLTLLKAAMIPDVDADKGIHNFKYAFYIWEGSFAGSRIVQEGYELNVKPQIAKGYLGKNSLFNIDKENIILDTLKTAEDGSGDIILRLYESMKMSGNFTLKTDLKIDNIYITDMLENKTNKLAYDKGTVVIPFTPFQVITLRIKLLLDKEK